MQVLVVAVVCIYVPNVFPDNVDCDKTHHVELELSLFKNCCHALVDSYVIWVARDTLLIKSDDQVDFLLSLFLSEVFFDMFCNNAWLPILLHAVS
jgi:hypothetical protein